MTYQEWLENYYDPWDERCYDIPIDEDTIPKHDKKEPYKPLFTPDICKFCVEKLDEMISIMKGEFNQ